MMQISRSPLEGVCVVDTKPIADHRGAFARFFCLAELRPLMIGRHLMQINHSRTSAVGAIRGLHFQFPPYAETKFVRCTKGRVWDVAVDLRKGSPSFLRWHAEELSSVNQRMMVIPEGVAHGFQVLEPDSELLYLHTAEYNKDAEGAIRYSDPAVAIAWPVPITDISLRDEKHPLLTDSFRGVEVPNFC